MTAMPHVAVVKPHFGANGGFERHLSGLIGGLREQGWRVTIVEIDGYVLPNQLYGLAVEDRNVEVHNEFFRYMALMEQFQQLRLHRYDAVLTTQPPTYLVRHPRKVAVFYHQARHFYDLSDAFVADGFVTPSIHRAAAKAVRTVEYEGVQDVRCWLAGSVEAAGRLRQYWNIPQDRIAVHYAPPTSVPARVTAHSVDGPVVNVGRIEWPKRTELFVNAIHLLKHERPAHLVGSGSRLEAARCLDAELHANRDLQGLEIEREPWIDQAGAEPRWTRPVVAASGRIRFEGNLSNDERDRLYANASVVVAPAYREDYGLTAIEAMIRARPVVVCRDGGGLTELVTDGVTGLVVEPRAEAVAEAIDRLVGDPVLAARLGLAGREAVVGISLDRAVTQVEKALRQVLEHW